MDHSGLRWPSPSSTARAAGTRMTWKDAGGNLAQTRCRRRFAKPHAARPRRVSGKMVSTASSPPVGYVKTGSANPFQTVAHAAPGKCTTRAHGRKPWAQFNTKPAGHRPRARSQVIGHFESRHPSTGNAGQCRKAFSPLFHGMQAARMSHLSSGTCWMFCWKRAVSPAGQLSIQNPGPGSASPSAAIAG